MIPKRKKTKRKFLESNQVDKGRFPRGTKQFSTEEDHPPTGMKKVHRACSNYYGHPHPIDDYNLIRRYLRRQVGRSWSEVYSDICRNSDGRTFEGKNLRELIHYAVEEHCHLDENGDPVSNHGYRIGRWGEDFYVHPTTKILSVISPKSPRRKFPRKIFEIDGKLYYRHDHIWYCVEMEVLQIENFDPNTSDISDVFSDPSEMHSWSTPNNLAKRYGRSPGGHVWWCKHKRSANSKEIAKIKKEYNLL